MEPMRCISCGSSSIGSKYFVAFPCPSCGKSEIRRCGRCKSLGREYICPECEFRGP